MRPADTEMGGSDRAFRTTLWADIQAAGDPTHPAAREHLDRLFRTYWKPVYAYIRSVWNAPADDAKDLTQAFFARLLEKEYWARLTPDRGSFRAYLKTALRHFLIDAKKHDAVRQAVRPAFSLEANPEVLENLAPVAPGESPDSVYDREWLRCLIDDSIEELRSRLNAEGKDVYFDVFRAYCIESGELGPAPAASSAPVTYAGIASRFGLKESDVRNYLFVCRRDLWELVRRRVRDYVSSEADVESELLDIVGG